MGTHFYNISDTDFVFVYGVFCQSHAVIAKYDLNEQQSGAKLA